MSSQSTINLSTGT